MKIDPRIFNLLSKGLRRLSYLMELFSLNMKRSNMCNNSLKYQGKPTFRTKAYEKALRNRKRR